MDSLALATVKVFMFRGRMTSSMQSTKLRCMLTIELCSFFYIWNIVTVERKMLQMQLQKEQRQQQQQQKTKQ